MRCRARYLILVAALGAWIVALPPTRAAAQEAPEASIAEDFPESLKDVPLTEDGRVRLSIGGEVRVRVEGWSDFAFSAADGRDDVFALTRLLGSADLRVGDRLRAFVEAESALAFDRDLPGGRRALDVDQLDLQQAYVEWATPVEPAGEGSRLALLLGRQELSYGKQRLVSALPWSNSQRSWDGLRARLETGDWRTDAFYTRYASVEKYDLNDWHPGPDFWGVYATGPVGAQEARKEVDLYYLGLESDFAVYRWLAGPETRHTVGARYGGPVRESRVDVDFEGGYQWGEVAETDVEAYFFAGEVGLAYPGQAWRPRVHVGLDYASGDRGPAGDLGTFNQLFPLGHAWLGLMDFVGRQNVIALSVGATVRPVDRLTLLARLHHFELAEERDALYNAGGGILRAPDHGNGVAEVGRELDVVGKYRLNDLTALEVGYGHFFAGELLEETPGPAEDVDWLYLQVLVTF